MVKLSLIGGTQLYS